MADAYSGRIHKPAARAGTQHPPGTASLYSHLRSPGIEDQLRTPLLLWKPLDMLYRHYENRRRGTGIYPGLRAALTAASARLQRPETGRKYVFYFDRQYPVGRNRPGTEQCHSSRQNPKTGAEQQTYMTAAYFYCRCNANT